jgi:hypothetical protein
MRCSTSIHLCNCCSSNECFLVPPETLMRVKKIFLMMSREYEHLGVISEVEEVYSLIAELCQLSKEAEAAAD